MTLYKTKPMRDSKSNKYVNNETHMLKSYTILMFKRGILTFGASVSPGHLAQEIVAPLKRPLIEEYSGLIRKKCRAPMHWNASHSYTSDRMKPDHEIRCHFQGLAMGFRGRK